MVGQKKVALLVTLVVLLTLALLYEYYGTSISPQSTSYASPTMVSSKETRSTHPKVSGVNFFKSFFQNMSGFYTKYRGTKYVLIMNSCEPFLLGELVNSTYMLINNTLYRYGVFAYKPMGEDYVILKELNLGKEVLIRHIPPQKNITITGGFGLPIWFNISVDGKSKICWYTRYVGLVFVREQLRCTCDVIKINNVTMYIVRLFFYKRGALASVWVALIPVKGSFEG